jgi:SAM-dependent methyltransferase
VPSAREIGRFLRVLPSRIPVKVASLLRAASGKASFGFPPDDFDQRTGLEAADRIKIHKLDLVNGTYVHPQGYAPVSPQALTDVLEAIPQDVSKHTFVDLDCGKGRALFVASQFGIEQIMGVEISPSLVRVARDNVTRWKKGSGFEIVCADASEWEWPRENLIVFLYNPFDRVILSKVLENLHKSLCANPRDVWLI